jgi:uncharacterized protein YodC (DUF2158 family)
MTDHIELAPGDVVQFLSGGRLMLVQDVHAGQVLCEWQDGTTFVQQLFSPDLLRVVERRGHK